MESISTRLETLRIRFESVADALVSLSALLRSGQVPATSQVRDLNEIVNDFWALADELSVSGAHSLQDLIDATASKRLQSLRERLRILIEATRSPQASSVLDVFGFAVASDPIRAIADAEALLRLSSSFSTLDDEDYDSLVNQVSAAFGERVARAAGRGSFASTNANTPGPFGSDLNAPDLSGLGLDSSERPRVEFTPTSDGTAPPIGREFRSDLNHVEPRHAEPSSSPAQESAWRALESRSIDASGPSAPPEASGPSAPPEASGPSAPPEASGPSAPPEASGPSAPPEASDPSAPPEASDPSAPPEASDPSAPPEASDPSAPPEASDPSAPPEASDPSAPPEASEFSDINASSAISDPTSPDVDYAAAWLFVVKHFGSRTTVAYHLAKALERDSNRSPAVPSWILRLSLLGGQIEYANLEIDDQIRSICDLHAVDELDLASTDSYEERSKALSLALSGVLLRPSLISSTSGARSLLHSVRFVGGAVHDLSTSVIQTGDRLKTVSVAHIRQLREQQASGTTSDDLRAEAIQWLRSAETSHIGFAEARKIRRTWLTREGLIDSLLRPVAENDKAKAPDVSDLLDRVSEAYIDRKIADGDSRTNKENIEGHARRQLHTIANSAVEVARRWLQSLDVVPTRQDYAAREFATLEQAVRGFAPSLESQLAEYEQSTSAFMRSAAQLYRKSYRSLIALFTSAPPATEPTVEFAESFGLLYTRVRLPDEESSSVVLGVQDLLIEIESQRLEWPQAFDLRMARSNYAGAAQIAACAFAAGDNSAPTAIERVEEAIAAQRRLLRDLVAATRSRLERAFTHHIIDDAARDSLASQIADMLTAVDESTSLSRVGPELDEIISTLDAASDAEKLKIRAEFSERQLDDQTVDRVERAMSAGLFNVAHEYLRNPGATKIPTDETLAAIKDLEHFRLTANNLYDAIKDQRPAAIARAVGQRARLGEVSFEQLTDVSLRSATDAIARWYEGFIALANLSPDHVRAILLGLDLPVRSASLSAKPSPALQQAKVFDVELDLPEQRNVVPIPAYGSLANGQYRVVALADAPSDSRLRRLVVDERDQRPVIVFYLRRPHVVPAARALGLHDGRLANSSS